MTLSLTSSRFIMVICSMKPDIYSREPRCRVTAAQGLGAHASLRNSIIIGQFGIKWWCTICDLKGKLYKVINVLHNNYISIVFHTRLHARADCVLLPFQIILSSMLKPRVYLKRNNIWSVLLSEILSGFTIRLSNGVLRRSDALKFPAP